MKSLFIGQIVTFPSAALLAISLLGSTGSAWGTGCGYEQAMTAGTIVNRFATTGLGCTLQLTPIAKPHQIYREFWLDERGRFLVVSSVEGPAETSVGYRTFFLFPRRGLPRFSLLPDGNVRIVTASGRAMTFAAADASLKSVDGGTFSSDPRINLENDGGIELQIPQLVIDSGFSVGTVSYADPARKSVVRDALGATCTVRNDELFSNEGTYGGEPNFRFHTDELLAIFLRSRCPGLNAGGSKRWPLQEA